MSEKEEKKHVALCTFTFQDIGVAFMAGWLVKSATKEAGLLVEISLAILLFIIYYVLLVQANNFLKKRANKKE